MVRILVGLAFCCWAGIATAQDAPTRDIQNTISNQMDAFRQGNVDGAWIFAAPNIRRMFGQDPSAFGRMVERGYPMVWNNDQVQFGELRVLNGHVWQQVRVTDAAGGQQLLDYMMLQTDAGWKIAAVQVLGAPDVGV
jgi:hypothetical protein